MSNQWRRLQFFDRTLVQEEVTNRQVRLSDGFKTTCSASGRGALLFGDQSGLVRSYARSMQYHQFQAHDASVIDMCQLRYSDYLVTLGFDLHSDSSVKNVDGSIGDASVKIWKPLTLDSSNASGSTSASTADSSSTSTNPTTTGNTSTDPNAPAPQQSNLLDTTHTLVKSFRLYADNVAPQFRYSPPTVVSMREDLSQIAIGFENGAVVVLDSPNLIRDRSYHTLIAVQPSSTSQVTHDPLAAVTKLLFLNNSNMSNCFVVTGRTVGNFVATRRQIYHTIIDSTTGAALNCAVLSSAYSHSNIAPSTSSSTTSSSTSKGNTSTTTSTEVRQLVIGTSDTTDPITGMFSTGGIYFYDTEDRSVCFAFNEPKRHIYSFGSYILVAGPEDATAPANIQRDVFTIYDLRNRLIAYSGRLDTYISSITSEWGSLFVLTGRGHVIKLTELDFQSKMELLFRKSLYSLAITLAQLPQNGDNTGAVGGSGAGTGTGPAGADKSYIVNLRKSYGDHLYSKGDIDGALEQYILVAEYIDPTEIIQKYLDPLRASGLASFLEALHSTGRTVPEHSTLLLNAYTRLGHVQKITAFVVNVIMASPKSLLFNAFKYAMENLQINTGGNGGDGYQQDSNLDASNINPSNLLLRGVSNFTSLFSNIKDSDKDGKELGPGGSTRPSSTSTSGSSGSSGSNVSRSLNTLLTNLSVYSSVNIESTIRVLHKAGHLEHVLLLSAACNLHQQYISCLLETKQRFDVISYISSLPRSSATDAIITSGSILLSNVSSTSLSNYNRMTAGNSSRSTGNGNGNGNGNHTDSLQNDTYETTKSELLGKILQLCISLCTKYIPSNYNQYPSADIIDSTAYQASQMLSAHPAFNPLKEHLLQKGLIYDDDSIGYILSGMTRFGYDVLESQKNTQNATQKGLEYQGGGMAGNSKTAPSTSHLSRQSDNDTLEMSFGDALMSDGEVKKQSSDSLPSSSTSTSIPISLRTAFATTRQILPIDPIVFSRLFLDYPAYFCILLEKVINTTMITIGISPFQLNYLDKDENFKSQRNHLYHKLQSSPIATSPTSTRALVADILSEDSSIMMALSHMIGVEPFIHSLKRSIRKSMNEKWDSLYSIDTTNPFQFGTTNTASGPIPIYCNPNSLHLYSNTGATKIIPPQDWKKKIQPLPGYQFDDLIFMKQEIEKLKNIQVYFQSFLSPRKIEIFKTALSTLLELYLTDIDSESESASTSESESYSKTKQQSKQRTIQQQRGTKSDINESRGKSRQTLLQRKQQEAANAANTLKNTTKSLTSNVNSNGWISDHKYTEKILNLLTTFRAFHCLDMNQAIFLCETYRFESGIILLYTHLHRYHDLAQMYIKSKEKEKFFSICLLFGKFDVTLWPSALQYFVDLSKKMSCDDYIKVSLQEIEKINDAPINANTSTGIDGVDGVTSSSATRGNSTSDDNGSDHTHRTVGSSAGDDGFSNAYYSQQKDDYKVAYVNTYSPAHILEILAGKNMNNISSMSSMSSIPSTTSGSNPSNSDIIALARRNRNCPFPKDKNNGTPAIPATPNVSLSVVKDYLLNILQSDNATIMDCAEEIANLENNTNELYTKLDKLSNTPTIFKDDRCKGCSNQFSLHAGGSASSVIHFLCGHSFHIHCTSVAGYRSGGSSYGEFLGDDVISTYDDVDDRDGFNNTTTHGGAHNSSTTTGNKNQYKDGNDDTINSNNYIRCPACVREIAANEKLRTNLKLSLENYEHDFQDAQSSDAQFAVIAKYYSRNVFGE